MHCGQRLAIVCPLIASGFLLHAQRDFKIERIEAKRSFALVIGNNSYAGAPLKNAVNDARVMQQVLQDLGYQTSILVDGNQRAMQFEIDRFASQLAPGDVALFYYAGHGVQIDGENYLVPVDFNGRDETDLKYQSISASWVQEKLDRSNAQLKILIFDACRTNPFRRSRGSAGGLAQMQGGRGTFIAFATAAGKVANDNVAESNGLFTQYLVNALKQPGETLDDVFNHVREDVDKASGGEQLPYVYSGVLGQYYFRPPAAAAAAGNPPPANGGAVQITKAVLAREFTPSYLDPSLAEPESEFLTTDPHAIVMFTYTGGRKGDKIRGEWRNPFGSANTHFDIVQANDGGVYFYGYILRIAGAEAERMPGNWELRIFCNDQGIAILPFHVSVPVSGPVQLVNSTVLTRATVNVPYRYQLRAAGGSAPYSWVSTGTLPQGLALSADGVLSGAPTRAGSFRLFVRAQDSAGSVITRTLGLGVGVQPQAIRVTRNALTKSLPSPDPCASPTGVASFSPRDAEAWLVFSVDGDKQGDQFSVEWLGPFGEVEQGTPFQRKADRPPCYQVKMPIAGAKASRILGAWNVRLQWLNGEALRIPFEIVEAGPAAPFPVNSLVGSWLENGANSCVIEQVGQELKLTNKSLNTVSRGILDGSGIQAPEWFARATISPDGSVLTWSNGNRWVKQPASNGSAGNRSAAVQKRLKDQAEYDLFNQALKDAGNPQQALRDLDAWKLKDPDSDFQDERNAMYVQAYAGANQPDKAVDLAAQLMKRNLAETFSNLQTGPQRIANLLYATMTAAQKIPNATAEQQATGENAARMLLAAGAKPDPISANDWTALRAALQARFGTAAPLPPPSPSAAAPVTDAPPSPQSKTVYKVGGAVSAPQILTQSEPEYTEAARKAGLQGRVVLSFVVTAEGRATDIKVTLGLGLGLDQQAVKALGKWKFKPGYKDGKPVDVALSVEMSFRLM